MDAILTVIQAWNLHQFGALLILIWILFEIKSEIKLDKLRLKNAEDDIEKHGVRLDDHGKKLESHEIAIAETKKDICFIKDKYEEHKKQG